MMLARKNQTRLRSHPFSRCGLGWATPHHTYWVLQVTPSRPSLVVGHHRQKLWRWPGSSKLASYTYCFSEEEVATTVNRTIRCRLWCPLILCSPEGTGNGFPLLDTAGCGGACNILLTFQRDNVTMGENFEYSSHFFVWCCCGCCLLEVKCAFDPILAKSH